MQSTNYPQPNSFLDTLLKAHLQEFTPIYNDAARYRLQIVYTRIDRDAQNRPHFHDYSFRADTSEYFYPASTVKLPAVALALEKLNDLQTLKSRYIFKSSPMFTDSLPGITPAATVDTTSRYALPSVAQYIKKILLVSDNDAFNRLYEFLGQEDFNKSLWQKGYPNIQIRHRVGLSGISPEQNRHTNAISFWQNGAQPVYQQPARYSALVFSPRHDQIGRAYYNDTLLVNSPMDASMKNRISLKDLHQILRSIIFPEAVTKTQRFRLKEDDYSFLYHCMSMQPEESAFPFYDTAAYPHNYVKFLLPDTEKQQNIRIFNKPGWAYGFLTDVAYIVDFDNKVEFMLSATIYVNEDGILSDEHYQFETTGKPFMKKLATIMYQYELQRKRKHVPDLSRFKMTYNK